MPLAPVTGLRDRIDGADPDAGRGKAGLKLGPPVEIL